MSSAIQFHTFHEMAAVMSHNMPHALVQDWWSRLERVIRTVCPLYGAGPREPVAKLIDKYLIQHPVVTPELVRELHIMRKLRNQCAHGEAPPLTVEESSAYAYRAWDVLSAIACGEPELVRRPARLNRPGVPTA